MKMKRGKKVMLLSFGYYLERELRAAFSRIGVECDPLGCENFQDGNEFVQKLIKRVLQTRPALVLSINGLGLDPEGVVGGLLKKLGIVSATWFVDSPELFLSHKPNSVNHSEVFCCDPDYRGKLEPYGITRAFYLPLACDSTRFCLDSKQSLNTKTAFDISFVGTTWTRKLGLVHKNFAFPRTVLTQYKTVSNDLVEQIFISCGSVFKNSTESFIKERHPDFHDTLRKLPPGLYNGALHLVLWEANRMYRKYTVSSFSGVKLALFGDDYWPKLVSLVSGNCQFFPEFSYYDDTLESLYRTSKISFNCSSAQMANAVNQRVFDVPAACGFLLTDYRAQIADLFDPGREIAAYGCIEELGEMMKKYLSDRQEASRITHAARKRILHEHTYVHRVRSMLRSLDIS